MKGVKLMASRAMTENERLPLFHSLQEIQKVGPSVLKYTKYAAGIIIGFGLIAGATVLGMHGLNTWVQIVCDGIGGLTVLSCFRLVVQRARFDHLVSKVAAKKRFTAEELSAPLTPKGKTPVQMALHRAKEDQNERFYEVAEHFLVSGASVDGLSVRDWENLFGHHNDLLPEALSKNMEAFLNKGLTLTEDAEEKIRSALESRILYYSTLNLQGGSLVLKTMYARFGGNYNHFIVQSWG